MTVRWRAEPPLPVVGSTLYADIEQTLPVLDSPAAPLLASLLADGATEDVLEEAADTGGAADLANWYDSFDRLRDAGRILPLVCAADGTPLVELLVAPGAGLPVTGQSRPGDEELELSRFAVLTPHGSGLLLEDPTAAASAVLDPVVLAERPAAAVALLREAGLLRPPGARDDQSWWEPHDLYFHWRTRRGRHRHIAGATFPHRPAREPLPVTKPHTYTERFPIADYATGSLSMPLSQVLQQRRTVREGSRPVDLSALATFLVSHRAREVLTTGVEYPQSRRWYPSGGATYEIDLYLATTGVAELPAGVWWFDAEQPALFGVPAPADAVDRLFADALVSTGGTGTPQVLISYGLRMGRNSWKYQSMAYRLALLSAGVLYEHAYLVGTALELALCGLGNGDSALFGELVPGEVSVAELMITGMR